MDTKKIESQSHKLIAHLCLSAESLQQARSTIHTYSNQKTRTTLLLIIRPGPYCKFYFIQEARPRKIRRIKKQ